MWLGASLMALGACSGGEDGPPTTLSGFDAEFMDLAEDTAGLSVTDPAMLPTAGSAAYEGVIRITASEASRIPDQMSGTLDLAVDFSSDALTGEATNFEISDEEDSLGLEGSLTVSGNISRDPAAENGMLAYINGSLDYEDPPGRETEGRLSIDGTLSGEFLGQDGEAIRGTVSGDIEELTVPDYIAPGQTSATLEGDFIVER